MTTTRLHNGSEELATGVSAVMLTLRSLYNTNPMAFYDAAMIARDPAYQPFGSNGAKLQALAILDGAGRMHASIRNVIASAVVGNGLDMSLRDPRVSS